MSASVNPELQSKILRKQKERRDQFEQLRKEHILTDKAKSIVNLPVLELQRKLQSREFSARQVLSAFIAKALDVTEKFNCITEFIPQSLKWASALDSEPNTIGPLHGLPVAIKEDHDVVGIDTTLGYAKYLYKPAAESSALVKVLMKLGAVPFSKTNVPQSLFSCGSENPIFGTTLNCHNANLAPGGSSSGSGCIVAAGGAPFATGSDLGGSLRIPSHFHGISTIRFTGNRLSEKGVLQCLPEATMPRGVPGIMAPEAETLAFVWKAITENNIQNQYDPMAVPIPWNENLFASREKLKIGYFTTLPFFPAFEDTKRTVLAAKAALESRGHKLVEFQMPDDFHYMRTIGNLLLGDGGKFLVEIFDGEPVSSCVAGLVESAKKLSLGGTEKSVEGLSKREKVMFDWGSDLKTAGDLWNAICEKRNMIEDILGRMEKTGVDLILSPSFPYPAVKLENGGDIAAVVYTMIWNFVDFPAGLVKFGVETGKDNAKYDDENDPVLKRGKEAISDSAGMPITVQIIGKPFKEEMVLRALVELENLRKS